MPADLLRYVVEKGSITVDGVSLTVAAVLDDGFTVAVIPHTAAVTTLGRTRPGRPRQPRGRRHGQVRRAAPAPDTGHDGDATVDDVSRRRCCPFAPIEDAVAAIGRGEIVVVVDDEDRENEGDLIMAAEAATPEKIAFFLRHTSGVICAPLTGERRRRARPAARWSSSNTESMRTAFTVTRRLPPRHHAPASPPPTGPPPSRRSSTPATRPGDLARPGHIFPLRDREGGVLKRAGHTEAAVDLARLAGLYPAGVLCEIVNDDRWTWPASPSCARFADEHGLLLISIADLIRYRRQHEKLVQRVAEARIPTQLGRLHLLRLRVDPRRRAARRPGAGRRCSGAGRRARPGAQRVPHRRRVRLAALRLRRAARRRPCS